jgi:hypothetical protein
MTDFYGLPTGTLGNDHLRLEYLAEAGPRLVRLFLNGLAPDQNLLAEMPDVVWPTPFGPYHVYGGHRLWHAPEAAPRTYIPDDDDLVVSDVPGGVELCRPTEAPSGLGKSLTILLHPERAALTLTHCISNQSLWPVELSPWAITQLPLGGVVILPQPSCPADHPLSPNRHLVLWPYTSWADPRLGLHDEYCLLHARPRLPPCKIGYFNGRGWAGYLRDGVLFVKYFQPRAERLHPDMGCNVETYCNDRYVELETVAPLSQVEPGQSVKHVEVWEFYSRVDAPATYEGVQALMSALPLEPRRAVPEA